MKSLTFTTLSYLQIDDLDSELELFDGVTLNRDFVALQKTFGPALPTIKARFGQCTIEELSRSIVAYQLDFAAEIEDRCVAIEKFSAYVDQLRATLWLVRPNAVATGIAYEIDHEGKWRTHDHFGVGSLPNGEIKTSAFSVDELKEADRVSRMFMGISGRVEDFADPSIPRISRAMYFIGLASISAQSAIKVVYYVAAFECLLWSRNAKGLPSKVVAERAALITEDASVEEPIQDAYQTRNRMLHGSFLDSGVVESRFVERIDETLRRVCLTLASDERFADYTFQPSTSRDELEGLLRE